MADQVKQIRDDLKLKSNSEAIKVALAAYDVINATGYGDKFTEAVKNAFNNKRGDLDNSNT